MPSDDTKALFDEAREHLQKAVRRTGEPTIVDGVLGPPKGSAPGPPRRAAVPRPVERTPLPAPELGSDPVAAVSAPEAPASEVPPSFGEREAPTMQLPGRRRRAPTPPGGSFYPHYAPERLSGMTPSVIAQAERMPLGRLLVVIASTATGVSAVIAAIGVSVVNILTALHPPSNTQVMERLSAVETRVNGDFGLPLEVKTRQSEDEKLRAELEKTQRAQQKLEGLAVPIKVQAKSRRGTAGE